MILCARLNLFDSFAQALEVRFSSVNNRFSQVLSGTSKVDNQDNDVSQDVLTSSFAAPMVVSGRAEPTPDRAPLAPCLVGLGTTLGGPAATVSPLGDSSPSHLSFADLLVTLRVLESSGGYLPDSFLAWLRGKVVYSLEPSFVVSGNAITDLIASLRSRVVDPLPGLSKDGDSVIPFICRLVGVSDSSPSSVVSASATCSAGDAGFVPTLPPPPPGFARLPAPSPSLPTPVSSAPVPSPFPGLVFCSSAAFVVRSSSFSLPGRSPVPSSVAPVASLHVLFLRLLHPSSQSLLLSILVFPQCLTGPRLPFTSSVASSSWSFLVLLSSPQILMLLPLSSLRFPCRLLLLLFLLVLFLPLLSSVRAPWLLLFLGLSLRWFRLPPLLLLPCRLRFLPWFLLCSR